MQDLEQVIRDRAYHLWVESGCEHGNAETHWLEAQREILSASLSDLGRVTTSGASAKSDKPKKAKASRKRAA
jgi:hypothetical protein